LPGFASSSTGKPSNKFVVRYLLNLLRSHHISNELVLYEILIYENQQQPEARIVESTINHNICLIRSTISKHYFIKNLLLRML